MTKRIKNEMSRCPPTIWINLDANTEHRIYNLLSPSIGMYQTIDGTNEGNFVPGILRINPVVISRILKTYKAGELRWTDGGPKGILSGPFEAYRTDFAPGEFDSGLAGQSITKAYSKIGKAVIDVGMSLAELPETLAMVKGGFQRLDSLLTPLQRDGGWRRLAGRTQKAIARLQSDWGKGALNADRIGKALFAQSKSLGNYWLTWRYGIRPLIGEISQYIQAFNGLAGDLNHGKFVRVRGKASLSKTSDRVLTNVPYGGPYVSLREETEVSIDSYSGIYFSLIRTNELYDFLERYGFAPHHMPSLAYELMPLSFMLDWFIDVGSWIRAITPVPDAKILGSYTSQKIVTTLRRKYTNAVYYGRSPSYADWPTDQQTTETLRRVLGPSVPAMPRFNWGLTLSISQYADLFTVALQRFKK